MSILAYGDPHGVFEPLLDAGEKLHAGDTIVIIGDFDAEQPIAVILQPLIERGINCFWVPGNHDFDNCRFHDNTIGSMPEANLDGQDRLVDSLKIGGLGGLFSEAIWYPQTAATEPICRTMKAYLQTFRPEELWRQGLPLSQRAFILPEVYDKVANMELDILFTHEAPLSGHEKGFIALDELAKMTGAKLLCHGHQHRSYLKKVGNLTTKGLAKREVWVIPMEIF